MVMSPSGFGPEDDCAGEGQQQLSVTGPSSRQRRCCIRTITASDKWVSMGLAPRLTDW
jgi:hypothetical protein